MSRDGYLEGLRELEVNLNKKLAQIGKVSKKALAEVAFDLLGEAMRRAPLDTGALRGSGYATVEGRPIAKVEPSEGSNHQVVRLDLADGPDIVAFGDVTAEVGFGEVYAARQHEHLEYHHDNGEAKFLENPLKERLDQYVNQIADSVRRVAE